MVQNNFAPAPSFRSAIDPDVHGALSVTLISSSYKRKGGKLQRVVKTHLVNGVTSVTMSNDRTAMTLSQGWEDSTKFFGHVTILSVIDHNSLHVFAGPYTMEDFTLMFATGIAD